MTCAPVAPAGERANGASGAASGGPSRNADPQAIIRLPQGCQGAILWLAPELLRSGVAAQLLGALRVGSFSSQLRVRAPPPEPVSLMLIETRQNLHKSALEPSRSRAYGDGSANVWSSSTQFPTLSP